MELWIGLVLFFGLAKGAREGLKKKALEKNGVMEVLFFHTALSFIIMLPFAHDVFGISALYHLLTFIKSFAIFLAWILAFNSIKKMPISYYGILDTARMLFSTAMALLFLNEQMTWSKGVGLAIVVLGLVIVNLGGEEDEKVKVKYLLMALGSCLLNAISGIMDKKLLATGQIDSSQLQFWYMLYMTALYGAYILIKRVPINLKTVKTNYWIVILSIVFAVADRALFIANEDPQSQVTVMTLLKQSSVLVTVLTGKLFFKEKYILKRFICALIVIVGICIATVL